MANNPLVFNTEGIRMIANKITTSATKAQGDHEAAWQRMQSHIQSYPSNLSNLLFEVLNPHDQRMRKSYDWQISFASALSSVADQVDEAESEMAQWF